MREGDLFEDFANDGDMNGKILLLLKFQNRTLEELKKTLADQTQEHKEFRRDIHELVETKTGLLATLQGQFTVFKGMMGAFGAIALVLASIFGYLIRTTMEQINVDHDRLIALETRFEQHIKGIDDARIRSSSPTVDAAGN